MKEKGQVFTTDMIFALLLMVTCLTISGQAYDIATGHATSYTQRYTLERETHDAADILIKTPGKPANWKDEVENLETLGLVSGSDNSARVNRVDLTKFYKLSRLIENEPIDNSIKQFFGGTTNFDMKIKENETTHAHFWPGWENENKPGAENSLEIASASRIVYGAMVEARAETNPFTLRGTPPGDNKIIEFWVGENETETYEWFLFCENKVPKQKKPTQVFYGVNKGGKVPGGPKIVTGGDYPDNVRIDNRLIEGQKNYVEVSTSPNHKEDIKIYVAIRPADGKQKITPDSVDTGPLRFQVRIWRD